jgi:hypothetical protein
MSFIITKYIIKIFSIKTMFYLTQYFFKGNVSLP